MKRSELKANAKEQLHGNWGWAVGLCFVGGIIASLASSFSVGILGGMVLYGVSYTFLTLRDGIKTENIFTAIFSGFTNRKFLPTLLTSLLTDIFIALWTILLFIPGIIKSYSYSMAPYIVKDMTDAGQEIAPTEAISASRKLMDGHKGELFLLDLSFIGWAILATIPLGLGWLWLTPYYQATKANYYRQLAGDQFRNIIDA